MIGQHRTSGGELGRGEPSGASDLGGVRDLAQAVVPDDLAAPDGGAADGGAPGTGLFSTVMNAHALPSGYRPRSVAVGDVTGDGLDDAVVGANFDPPYGLAVVVFAQTPAHTLAPPVVYAAGTGSYGSPNMLAIADLDGDGRLDVALTGPNDVRGLRQTASGALGAPRTLMPVGIDADLLLVGGDFDDDGHPDLVTADYNGDVVDAWFQREGLATAHTMPCVRHGADAIAVGDIDGDGRRDVVISSFIDSAVWVLLQGAGGFAPVQTISLSKDPPPDFVAAGDVDGDGRDEILLVGGGSRATGKYLDVLARSSDGTFALQRSLDTGWYATGLVTADVNGDGRVDVLVQHSINVGVYLQQPGGGLAGPEDLYQTRGAEQSGQGPQLFAVGDLDGDGKADLASVGERLWVVYHR